MKIVLFAQKVVHRTKKDKAFASYVVAVPWPMMTSRVVAVLVLSEHGKLLPTLASANLATRNPLSLSRNRLLLRTWTADLC